MHFREAIVVCRVSEITSQSVSQFSQKYLPSSGIQTFSHSGVPQSLHSCAVPHGSMQALHVRLMANPRTQRWRGGWDALYGPGRNV